MWKVAIVLVRRKGGASNPSGCSNDMREENIMVHQVK